jgi:leader peptidase (prepilin peptidase)/N-methyltransferase
VSIQTITPQMLLASHLPVMAFVFAFGACVGSFVNVVVHRLPLGMSVIRPPSRCPTCGVRLRFFRENVPILGWLMVRGRCRACGERVSPQYMLVELFVALLFLGLYVVMFVVPPGTPWWSEIGGQWWRINTIAHGWPAFVALTFMFAALVAMTLIDARTFFIPFEIPLFATVTAFIAHAVLGLAGKVVGTTALWMIPGTSWCVALAAFGAITGIVLSMTLIWTGRMKPSFADYDDYVKEGETFADYPHARREMLREIAFLLPCLVLGAAGFTIGSRLASVPPVVVQSLGGSVLGFLAGGGIVWAVRIIFTLIVGREAMGLGDVHLLAAVGAVLGWRDPLWIFFVAPFSGLLWAAASKGLARMLRTGRRELPYGPHLAVATLLVVLGRPGITWLWGVVYQGGTLPPPRLVTKPGCP